jgi:transitional endoplasmic reticulum ATPase
MKKDRYISYKSSEYSLKLIDFYNHKFSSDVFEFIHGQLSEKNIQIVNDFIFKEMVEFKKKNTKILSNTGTRRSPINRKVNIEDQKFLCDLKEELEESKRNAYQWATNIDKLYLNRKISYQSCLKLIRNFFEVKVKRSPPESCFKKNLDFLGEIFKLEIPEKELLTLMYLVKEDSDLESLLGSKPFDMDRIVKSLRLYCRFLNLTPKKMKEYLSRNGKLIKSGILEKDDYKGLELTDNAISYLAGISKMQILDSFFKQVNPSDSLSLEDHAISKQNLDSILNLLKGEKGTNILLYGKPGTGKTEFTKSLANQLNRPLYHIHQHDENGEENLNHRKSSIIAAQNLLDSNCIIVVDECDPIINSTDNMWLCENTSKSNDTKAWINSLLESTTHNIIWISNSTRSVHPSTKRRFSFTQEFKDFTKKQRRKAWDIVLEKNKVNYLIDDEIDELASKYKVNAGGISLAVQDINSVKSLRTPSAKKKMLESILLQHEKFVFGKVSKLVPQTQTYDANLLNLDTDVHKLIKSLTQFVKFTESHSLNADLHNMNVLFSGPPGTGKTELVKHISEQLGLELCLKRLSDIKSSWYGETLRNIAAIFEEAHEGGKLLFLDEADTFFVDRQTSHNEHHKEETNELLTQMENFRGILICATNFHQGLDEAVLRRFNYKIKFDFLTPEAKELLFNKIFNSKLQSPVSQELLTQLRAIQCLTPGDFKVVKQKHFFDERVEAQQIVDELQIESSYKKLSKPIRLT